MARDDIKRLAFSLVMAMGLCAVPATGALAQSNQETVFWESVRDSGSAEQLRLYISRYPDGAFRELAELKLRDMKGVATARAQSAQEDCDRLAGHPNDATLPVKPTLFDDLKKHIGDALAACKAAHEAGGDPRYTFQYARALVADGQEAKAFAFYQQAADAGHMRASFRVGLAYEEGLYGVKQDRKKALLIYVRDATKGEADAAFRAGWLLDNAKDGDGFEQDFRKALAFYKQAEAGGSKDALYPIGYMYERGRVVDKDVDTAIRYYRQSIEETSFYRNTVRKRLADILFNRFTSLYAEEVADGLGMFDEYAQLLIDRAGTSKDAHQYAVGAILVGVDYVFRAGVRLDGDDAAKNALSAKLMASLDELSRTLIKAMERRHAALPDSFPNQTDAAIDTAIKELVSLYRKRLDMLRSRDAFLDYAEQHHVNDCITRSGDWAGDAFHVSFRNSCKYAMEVSYLIEIEYTSSSYRDETETGTLIVEPGDRERASYYPNYPKAGIAAAYNHRACYEEEGFKENDWAKDGYRCNSLIFDGDPGLIRNDERIRELKKQIETGA